MKKITLFLLFAVFAVTAAMAQQDCPQVDCPGICGRFVDADGDGFCDHGKLSAKEKATAPAEQTAPAAQTPQPKKPVRTVSDESATATQEVAETAEAPVLETTIAEPEAATEATNGDEEPAEAPKPFRYPLFTILGVTLALYLFTFAMVKTDKMAKPTHRKIWNVVLGLTCLVSCLLGVVLAFLINYGIRPTCYVTLLHWHVYFGIAMTLIAIFHIFWHTEYFKAIFKRKK